MKKSDSIASTQTTADTIATDDSLKTNTQVSFTLDEEQNETNTICETIKGTPIVVHESGVDKVPEADKFSVDITDFRTFEMLNNSTGQYKNLINLTKKLSEFNDENEIDD